MGDVPHSRLFLGSEVAEASTETIECVLSGVRRCAETVEVLGIRRRYHSKAGEAIGISRRHRTEPIEAVGISRRNCSKAGEASKGRHRHHSKAANKGCRHCAKVGILHVESVEAGIYDLDCYFGFSHGGLVIFLSGGFTLGLALGASFCCRKLCGGVFFCRQDSFWGCACLSREELHGSQNTNGQYGQEECDIGRNSDQWVGCLCNSNSVCRDILGSLLTASCYRCLDVLASVSNNVVEKSFIVPDIVFSVRCSERLHYARLNPCRRGF